MYRKLLVALDHSSASDDLFAQALELAQATQGQLLLVHSLSSEEAGSPSPFSARFDNIYWAPGTEIDVEAWRQSWVRYETESRDRLQKYTATANSLGVAAEFRQLVGPVAAAICKAAQEWGTDLIIVGNRGRTGLTELVLGSVSNAVMHRAPCGVMVIKTGKLSDAETPAIAGVA
ncbi:universal stress protein [Nodosilinea sp. LEGE 07088]|uniref:universal stress protein n=1 Tax=Nodosilinea sp. LEGE 07088 TaxID=2777968 RepID=UPI00187FF6CF|nr:universal stress protein [Nodosilinea sp. LEGE 07088]MBE9138459.1 universal stress protein [Nodosilinea sp. LEGE 07088]